MYQKFIITQDGVLKFGRVYLHHDLLSWGEDGTGGGGLWKMDPLRGAIMLYGRSFEFGAPLFNGLKHVNWDGIDGKERLLFYQPHWPYDETLVPVALF